MVISPFLVFWVAVLVKKPDRKGLGHFSKPLAVDGFQEEMLPVMSDLIWETSFWVETWTASICLLCLGICDCTYYLMASVNFVKYTLNTIFHWT